MKNRKNHKNAGIAAAALAVLGFSTVCMAEAPKQLKLKEGVSLAELRALSNNSAEPVINGRTLRFAGSIPAECAQGASLSSQHKDGRHLVTIRLAENCEAIGFASGADAKRVHLSDVLKFVNLEDKSGAVFVVFKARSSNDPLSPVKISDPEALGLVIEGSREAAARLEREQAAELARERLAVARDLERLCNAENYLGLGEEIEANRALLGDLADVLAAKSLDIQVARFAKKLDKAETSARAREIFNAYLEAADANGWDPEQINKEYINKQNVLLHAEVAAAKSDSKLKLAPIAKALRSWKSELARLDRKKAEALKSDFAAEFKNLGNIAVDRESYSEAAELFVEAADMVGGANSEAVRGQAVGAYVEAYKLCVEKNPMKSASCDGKFRKPAEKIAEKIMKDKERAAKKNDEMAGEYASFSQEYYQVFGAGSSMYQSGFGWYKQMPGSLDTFKYQALQNAQMEQYQKQMQMMNGGYAATAGQSGGFFNLGR